MKRAGNRTGREAKRRRRRHERRLVWFWLDRLRLFWGEATEKRIRFACHMGAKI